MEKTLAARLGYHPTINGQDGRDKPLRRTGWLWRALFDSGELAGWLGADGRRFVALDMPSAPVSLYH